MDMTSSSSSHCIGGEGAKSRAQSDEAAASKIGDASVDENKDALSSSDCPLFMDGLPSNFAANAGLAAIASLLDDGDDEGEKECKKKEAQLTTTSCQAGGGKARKASSKRNKHSPYSKNKDKDDREGKKRASMGEAQLFLNMWKI